jgi:hypothetical protein
LAGLEVVTADEGVVALGELDGTGNESVLGGAVDEGDTFKDAGYGEDSGGGDLFVAGLNGLEEVVGGVVDAFEDLGEALGVGSPLDDYFVEVVVGLEAPGSVLEDGGINKIVVTYWISLRICSTWALDALVPGRTLSARSSWLAAMKSG